MNLQAIAFFDKIVDELVAKNEISCENSSLIWQSKKAVILIFTAMLCRSCCFMFWANRSSFECKFSSEGWYNNAEIEIVFQRKKMDTMQTDF